MPNNIYNTLVVIGTDEQVNQVLEHIKGEPFDDGSEMYIDFNKIIKKPKELDVKSGGIAETFQFLLFGTGKAAERTNIEEEQSFIKRLDPEQLHEGFNDAIVRQANLEEFRYSDWYDWSIANWGTKWNAYFQSLHAYNVIYFNTAWNGVPNLMIKLSSIFSEVTLKYLHEDYDDSWEFEIKNGELLNHKKEKVVWEQVKK